MKVDLHCHTKRTKAGDGTGCEVNADTFVKAVRDADVSIVAITNHNHFSLSQYQEFCEAANDTFMIWPGVELDVAGDDGCKWHTLVLCSPERVEGPL